MQRDTDGGLLQIVERSGTIAGGIFSQQRRSCSSEISNSLPVGFTEPVNKGDLYDRQPTDYLSDDQASSVFHTYLVKTTILLLHPFFPLTLSRYYSNLASSSNLYAPLCP